MLDAALKTQFKSSYACVRIRGCDVQIMRVQFILPYLTTESASTGKVPRSLLRMLTRELYCLLWPVKLEKVRHVCLRCICRLQPGY